MNKFVTTALAVAAAGTLSHADPGDNDWLELDGEINDLATALRPADDDSGGGWSGLFRGTYDYSTDDVANGNNDANDISGIKFRDVDVAFYYNVGTYGARFNVDVNDNLSTSPGLKIEDAHVWFECGQYANVTFGNQKPRVLRSGYVDPERTLFIDRTALGSTFDVWNQGIQAGGNWEAFSYALGLFNGQNTNTKDHVWNVRVAYDFGAGAGDDEGALNGGDDLNFTVGGSYVIDNSSAAAANLDDTMWALDVNGNMGQFSLGAEVAGLEDGWTWLNVSNDYSILDNASSAGPTLFSPDSTPWNVTLGFLLNPEWEFGVRYENTDSLADTKVISVGASWYRAGHNSKWQAQYQNFDSDTGSQFDGSVFSVGVTVGATR